MDFDFLSSNLQIAYPFQQNVTVGRLGVDTELAPIVAAARIRTIDQRDERLTLESVYVESSDDFVTLDEADLGLAWQPSGDVVDLSRSAGTANAVVQLYGSWIVVEWYAPNELSGAIDLAAKLIFPTSAVETLPSSSSSSSSSSSAGVISVIQIDKTVDEITFHTSVTSQGPKKVRRVYWKRGDAIELLADRNEEFIVQAGFNMSLGAVDDDATEEGRQLTRVSVDAVPGAGFGKYLICRGSEYLITMNGVAANKQGELVLNPLECYWPIQEIDGEIEPQTASHGITGTAQIKPNEVKIGNACGPCCSCDDYIATYNHLHELWLRAIAVSGDIYALNSQYEELIALYEDIVGSCEPIALVLVQTPTDILYTTIALCNDTISTLNNSPETTPLLQFDLEFVLPAGVSTTYMVGSGTLSAPGGSHQLEPDSYTGLSAVIKADLPVTPHNTIYWTGAWTLGGVLATKVIDATVLATEGDLPAPRSIASSITLE